MGRHTRTRGRRALRPVAVTSVLAVGLVGAIAVAATFGTHASATGHPAGTAAAFGAASPTATPGDGTTARDEASHAGDSAQQQLASVPSYTPSPTATADGGSGTATSTAADAGTGSGKAADNGAGGSGSEGTTGTAAAGAESARVGALFSGGVAPGNHFCTASVLHSPGRNLILTAAHCLTGTDGVTFVPGYRNGQTPYGSWKVTKIFTSDGWQNSGDQDEDFAILQVAPNDGKQIEDVVGGNQLGTDAGWSATVRLYGYPASTEAPILCTDGTSRQDTYQRRIDCPSFPGGTSGGPWIDTSSGRVIGVIGGYQQGGDSDDTSYSSSFDQTIAKLYAQAAAAG